MIVDLPRVVAAGRPVWSELEEMLDRIEADPDSRLPFEMLRRFYMLYQRVSADLVRIQAFAGEPELCRYLESLTARAYAEIHGQKASGGKLRLWHWFTVEFPRVFQRHVRAFQFAFFVTMLGAVFGAASLRWDDDSAKSAIFPSQFGHLLGDPAKRVQEEEARHADRNAGHKAAFSAYLMRNNINVSIFTLALGITWGLGSIINLFYNGVILGAVVLDYLRAGQSIFLFGWLMPHGVIELPAVMIAGQGAFVLARALLGGPGRMSLRARLRAIGPDLVTLIGGVAVMLVWAGLIEAFLSQLNQPIIPYAVKIAFGAFELAGLVWFLNRRLPEPEASAAA